MRIKTFLRKETGKGASHQLKAAGKLPAIIYGRKKNQCLGLLQSTIQSLFLETKGKMQVLELEIEELDTRRAIIQDYQYSRVKKKFLHIDFLEVTDDTILHLDIPIRTIGDSIVAKMGGVEQVIRREIPIVCKAKDIPEYIEIDISELSFGSSIHVLDIPYPQGVKPVVIGRNFTIISTSEVSEEVEEEVEVEAAAEEEVDKEKKEKEKEK